jgi:hypothetical protein
MKEKKIIYKWIWAWDFEKEEQWLNEMAMNGWVLCAVSLCRFTFEKCEPGEYIVRLEMHGVDDVYINFMRETGAVYIGRVAQWIYFCKKTEYGSFDIFSDIDLRITHLDRIGKLFEIVGFKPGYRSCKFIYSDACRFYQFIVCNIAYVWTWQNSW